MHNPTTLVTKALAQTALATNSAAALEAAHPTIPSEKLSTMVVRVVLGGAIILVGLALLAVLVVKPALDKTLSTTNLFVGLGAGLAVFAWGCLTISSQLAGTPLATVVGIFKGVWTTVRPGGSSGG
jgi:uncharacterized membrane protein